jgi:hypothetical protein
VSCESNGVTNPPVNIDVGHSINQPFLIVGGAIVAANGARQVSENRNMLHQSSAAVRIVQAEKSYLAQDVVVDVEDRQFPGDAQSLFLELFAQLLPCLVIGITLILIINSELPHEQPVLGQWCEIDFEVSGKYRTTSPRPLLPRSK